MDAYGNTGLKPYIWAAFAGGPEMDRQAMKEIRTYTEFAAREGIGVRARSLLRNLVIRAKSQGKQIDQTSNWVRFPYYHHVFDDERHGFERQLKYLGNFGDFISMDEACDLISGDEPVDGRYFCVGFDDGFANCYTNMTAITSRLRVPVIIYLPVNWIGLNTAIEADREKISQFYAEQSRLVPFLTWEQCREMLSQKISFGSHTLSHAHLIKLRPEEIEKELKESKRLIEVKLGVPCQHFACPWGRRDVDFDPAVTTPIAQRSGYHSFATTNRGKMQRGDDLYMLRRDHVSANWENFQLKYFFSL